MNKPTDASRVMSVKKRVQRGVGLIEVLVALLIFSIGLLGLAQLQIRSLAQNNQAMSRSMATIFSYSIVDAMRVDRTRIASYTGTVSGDSCDGMSDGTFAQDQLKRWCQSLEQSIAGSAIEGKISCPGGNVCTITVSYVDEHTLVGTNETQEVVTVVAI